MVRRAAWQGYKGPPGPVDISKLQGFTPAQLLSYAAELTRHSAALTVAAAPQACFDAWQDRANHQHFLTLAQQIGWDNGPEEPDAIYEFYYRWGGRPPPRVGRNSTSCCLRSALVMMAGGTSRPALRAGTRMSTTNISYNLGV